MNLTRYTLLTAIFVFLSFTVLTSYGQLGYSLDIKKPPQFDDRILASEKSGDKKFSLTDRFIQNTFTHYNYFFNAKNKLNEIIELAKNQHVDDYDELLSFYNYSLDMTARNRAELDLVLSKSSTGIVLHDLRNDWIDNHYMLIGAAYYFRKQFDSAYLTFQFINYAFFESDKDGYYRNIGSNLDGNNALSISTKEKTSLPRKVFSEPPSRNEALLWMTRTLIAQEEYAEAASLIVTLKNDPVFPSRLKNDLEEIQALWFYQNNMPDSAALHLTNALDNAPTKNEKARWEFLIAQLYERSNNFDMARSFFDKVTRHTSDPVMEMYARLFSIRVNRSGSKDYVDKNIAELLKMAHRDRYIDYRDIIYYTLAQMEAERGNIDAAQKYLAKSAEFNTSNRSLKNKAWLQLAELAFHQKKYVAASNAYDSIDLMDPSLHDLESIRNKKMLLTIIKTQIEIIERQDSLQKIAAMPEDERKEFVKKLTRKLRKEQGLKEEPGLIIPIADKNQTAQPDLFTTAPAKGEWYFYNATLRTRGFTEFKSKWGNRANADNWRRSAGISIAQTGKPITGIDSLSQSGAVEESGEINFDALYSKLPLTEELLYLSNDSISTALYILGKLLSEELEDCGSAIQPLEELKDRFPQYENMNEVLFKLYYCYNKSGQPDKAAGIKKLMEEKFPGTPLTSIVVTGKDPGNKKNNPDATKAYEQVYDLFIEGDFKKAIAEKEKADAQFGENYWTPQLMYIETVYYIKQNQDEKAYETLGKIIRNFPGTPIAEKAITLSQVLSRRKQIEEELTNLKIEERPKEVAPPKTADTIATKTIVKAKPDTATVKPKQQVAPPVIPNPVIPTVDSVKNVQPASAFVFNPTDKYSAMLLLNKVDMVWANETKNAFNIYNRNKYYNKQFNLSVADINGEYRVLLIGTFENAQAALEYMQDAKKLSATQILPWLKTDKYSFSIISAENFELLKSLKDVDSYKQFIEKSLPGKF